MRGSLRKRQQEALRGSLVHDPPSSRRRQPPLRYETKPLPRPPPRDGEGEQRRTPPPHPLPCKERGSRRGMVGLLPLPETRSLSFSPSPLRGGGWGEGLGRQLSLRYRQCGKSVRPPL